MQPQTAGGGAAPTGPSRQSQVIWQLADMSWPVIGLNLLNVLALAVDTAMCGHLPQATDALTALGYATQLVFVLMVGMIGLSVGTVATIARAHGAGDRARVAHALQQGAQLAVLLGLAVAVVGNAIAAPFVRAMGGSEPVVELATSYLRPLLAATALPYLNVLLGAALRAVGNTRLALGVALVVNGANALFNYAFVLGGFGLPGWGLAGAAWGTVLAYLVGVAVMVTLLRRGAEPALPLPWTLARLDRPLVATLLRIGWPAALDMMAINVAFLSIVGMLGRVDEVAVAAHGVGLRIQALAFVPGLSIGQVASAMVGQALGARLPDRVKLVTRASIVLNVAVMSTLGLVLFAFDEAILSIFRVDPSTSLGAHALTWMHLLGAGMPIAGVHVALVGVLQGAGATMTSLRINGAVTVVQIAGSWLLGFAAGLGPAGIWLAFPLSFLLKVALSWRAVRGGAWAGVRI